jgi:dienelactone hydrolase
MARNFSPWAQWMLALTEVTPTDPLVLPIASREELDAWRDRVRARVDDWLASSPDPVPLDLERTSDEQRDGYRQERIVLDSEATMSVPALLLVPDGRDEPGSAVLAIHGHGPGKEAICSPDLEPTGGDYGHRLALDGHVVLAPDLRTFGERADWNPPDHYACDTNLVHAVMAGVSPLAQNLWDLGRCLDVLAAHPLVDPARIGVVGFSYGATLALFLAATDARVAAAVVSGYFSSVVESHKMPWNMCGSQVLPGMLGRIEHVDLGALVAPRPLLVESGRDDLLFPIAVAEASVEQLRAVYAALGGADHLEHHVFDGDHRWDGSTAYGFLRRWLC